MPNGVDDPRTKDYAIIIGVTRYPKLTRDGGTADLQGSAEDARKIRDWLESDEGGGVPSANIEYIVRGSRTPVAVADPGRDLVAEAFIRMWDRCWTEDGAPKSIPLGRRLYVYVSGHGLSGDLEHGVLLCSNSSNRSYATIGPYLSIQDFRRAGFFREFVIWFDGCMDWTSVAVQPIDYQPPPGNDLNQPGLVFTAYAAHPRLRTVEAPDKRGQKRGVFTRTLLAGLEGDAAESGQIDSLSLQKYLFNAMPNYLPASAWNDILVDKQPFVRTDPGIIFSRAAIVQDSPIVFDIGLEYDGAEAQIWGSGAAGSGMTLMNRKVIAAGSVTFSLPRGIYFVVVPEHSLRQGFEVTGGMATKLKEG